MAVFCAAPVPSTLTYRRAFQAQLRRQNESVLRDVSLKAGALREHKAKHDSSRAEIEQLQQQVRLPDLPHACHFLPPSVHGFLHFQYFELTHPLSQCSQAELLQ